MACHYLGEQQLRKQATNAKKPFDYVIIRPGLKAVRREDEIFNIHAQGVSELKAAAIAVSLTGIGLIVVLGWAQGIPSLVAVDVLLVLFWRKFYADMQI